MRIGEASNASGVPERMIRHYERLGLVPEPARETSGYRLYAVDDVRRLRFISLARALGFGMSEIGEIMAGWPHRRSPAVAAAWLERIAAKAEALEDLRAELVGSSG